MNKLVSSIIEESEGKDIFFSDTYGCYTVNTKIEKDGFKAFLIMLNSHIELSIQRDNERKITVFQTTFTKEQRLFLNNIVYSKHNGYLNSVKGSILKSLHYEYERDY